MFIFGLYPILQLGFYKLIGNYMSLNSTGDGAGRVTEYVGLFIKSIRLEYYLCLLPFVVLIVESILRKGKHINHKRYMIDYILTVAVIAFLFIASLLTLEVKAFDSTTQIKTSKELYYNPTLIELSLKKFGAIRFMWRDIVYMINPTEEKVIIDIDENKDDDKTDNSRIIDDTNWQTMIDSEKDSTIKMLHEYYINQSITPKNEMTGLFKDKNMILIMVEAFDMIAINETLTPTLYKIAHEGWYFDNYYTPIYSCATGQSEFIGLTSLVPSITECTPNTYTNNNYSTSIFSLFNKSGYYSTSYHNWTDQYYNRTELHANMGSIKFYNYDVLDFNTVQGWQSDNELMQLSLPHFVDQDKFFTFMITSSTHFPYDRYEGIIKWNWEEVKDLPYNDKIKYYMAKAIELDKGVKTLLDELEAKGKLDDTVIALFGDHHPLHMEYNYLNDASPIDRYEDFNIDRLPFIIYNSEVTPTKYTGTASTFDILPTLANLFDLDYDPRYYYGTDYFSEEEKVVIFANGSWITNRAMYFAPTGEIKKIDPTVDDEYVQSIHKKVKDDTYISGQTHKKNYFEYRFNNE
jgi:phosphoglycerol transferase MdoB-like AlkP superfamily enzyme